MQILVDFAGSLPRGAAAALASRTRSSTRKLLNAQPEVLRRDVLELVRLVHDERRAGRDHLAVLALPHGRVGAQQMVIDDDDVGFRGALAHQRDEAVAVARALGAEARVGFGGDLLPQRQVFGQVAQLRAVAGRRLSSPTRR